MELEKLKASQEYLKGLLKICALDIKFHNVLGVDSAYLSKEDVIISTAVIYNADKKNIIEKSFYKKKFHFPISLVFCHIVR